jgi:hypothetical protein
MAEFMEQRTDEWPGGKMRDFRMNTSKGHGSRNNSKNSDQFTKD